MYRIGLQWNTIVISSRLTTLNLDSRPIRLCFRPAKVKVESSHVILPRDKPLADKTGPCGRIGVTGSTAHPIIFPISHGDLSRTVQVTSFGLRGSQDSLQFAEVRARRPVTHQMRLMWLDRLVTGPRLPLILEPQAVFCRHSFYHLRPW